MSQNLDLMQTLHYLTGLNIYVAQSLESPSDPWLWVLEISGGPEKNGELLPWVVKFKPEWAAFVRGKRLYTEISLIQELGKFLQENYFDRNDTTS